MDRNLRSARRLRMDASVICVEDSSEVIDLSESLTDAPQNSRDNLYQEFFLRQKNKKNEKNLPMPVVPEAVIDLSNESDFESSNGSSSKQSEEQKRKSTDMCCPVCFEKYSEVQLKATVCGHVFCAACIEATVKETRSCPKCRKKLTPKNLIPLYL